ncbi:hypothetical protein HQ34_01645 [Porphyromonas cangingivalis]|nr:hypothetical protein HQ34_01645 [Porphyromonas cangingivalis]
MTSSVTQGEGIIRSLPVDLIASKTDLTIICKSSVFSTIDTTKIYIIITSPNKLKKKIPNIILTLKTLRFPTQKDKKTPTFRPQTQHLERQEQENQHSLFFNQKHALLRQNTFRHETECIPARDRKHSVGAQKKRRRALNTADRAQKKPCHRLGLSE